MLTSLAFWFGMFTPAPPPAVVPKPPPAPAVKPAAPTAADVITNVQAFYAGTKQMTAKFRQTVTNAVFGTTDTNDGMFWIVTPDKIRCDYLRKPTKKAKVAADKSFLFDGTRLTIVDHKNKQVIKTSATSSVMPAAVSFLTGASSLAKDFTAKLDVSGTYGAKGDLVVELTPNQPSAQYAQLFLVVAPDNFRVTQSIVIDPASNVNHFRFYEPDLTTAIDAALFKFNRRSVPSYSLVTGSAPVGGSAAAGSGAGSGSAPAPVAPKTPAPAPAKAPAK